MTDEELTKEFIRCETEGISIQISVCQIRWLDSHTPEQFWKSVASIPGDKPLEPEIASILNNSRYFDTCKECGERNPVGWMFRRGLCQSCAEQNHGVVF